MGTEPAFDVLVIGAGPAGMAAAWAASMRSSRVGLIDDNPAPGGQIWREGTSGPPSVVARRWRRRLIASGVEVRSGLQVVAAPEPRLLVAEGWDSSWLLRCRALILATGARELFLPFPGWTLPGVAGAGGLQALAKSGLPVEGRQVVLAGSGPLLLAVADLLRKRGADVRLVAEQAPAARVARFGAVLLAHPRKLLQAALLRARLRRVPYRLGAWPTAAQGERVLTSVRMRQGEREWEESCDLLGCGFGLVPQTELARLLGCEAGPDGVQVDEWQATSVEGVFAAGELTGIGGVDLALVEGHIAGHAATGDERRARRLFGRRRSLRRFARGLAGAFAPRDELRGLARGDTVVCRCEDVRLGELHGFRSARDAKLQTRCGMGPCQGRTCAPVLRFLFGWETDSIRPPAFPSRVKSLAAYPGSDRGER